MGVNPRTRFVTPNVAMELWDLQDSNDIVIGFGAKETPSWSTPLSDPRIQTIKDRWWAEQHLSTFDVAIELPESLVTNTVRYSDSPLRLTMFIYRKTGLFVQSELTELSRGDINSAIISASLGGRRIRDLEENVRVVFKPFKATKNRQISTHCVFWDKELEDSAQWSKSGCVYNGTLNGRDVCLCNHLTNFAILTDFYGDMAPISPENETALTVLTIIGLVLSIIGLSVTIITFLAFKKLRQGRAQQTLFNMAIALLCFQTTFLVGVKQTSIMPVCLVVAVLLHYFILVSFAWMLIEAVLQYLTFVKVLGTYISHYTLKTVVPAWGVPLVPVTAVLATDYRLYLGRVSYCWMNLQAFYYAFALPVGIIIVFNIVMFLIIIVSLATKPRGLRSNQSSNKARKTNLKAAVTIFVLLGLTWLFGYLAIEDARLPFQYAFTILSSLQGFLIFLLMVARRRQVRDQWEIMCCIKCNRNQNKQKKLSPTISNSTTFSNSNNNMPNFSNRSYTGDSIILSSSTGRRSQSSFTA